MKSIALLSFLAIVLTSACHRQLHRQLEEVHQSNQTLMEDTGVLMDGLIQIRNQINIQGRALTRKEMEMVEKINALDLQFQELKKSFPPQKDRITGKALAAELEKQQAFQEQLTSFKGKVVALSEAPSSR